MAKYPATAAKYAQQLNRSAVGSSGNFSRLADDPEHWASVGVHTGEELAKSLAYSAYSDTFKQFNGIRPRHVKPDDYTVEELEAMTNDLYSDFEEDDHWDRENDFLRDEREGEAAAQEPGQKEDEDALDDPRQKYRGMKRPMEGKKLKMTVGSLRHLMEEVSEAAALDDQIFKLRKLINDAENEAKAPGHPANVQVAISRGILSMVDRLRSLESARNAMVEAVTERFDDPGYTDCQTCEEPTVVALDPALVSLVGEKWDSMSPSKRTAFLEFFYDVMLGWDKSSGYDPAREMTGFSWQEISGELEDDPGEFKQLVKTLRNWDARS